MNIIIAQGGVYFNAINGAALGGQERNRFVNAVGRPFMRTDEKGLDLKDFIAFLQIM